MDQNFASPAIQTLQQAYGFSTDTPLWDSRKLFELLTAAYPGLTEIRSPRQKEIVHVMHSWALGAATISAGSHSETFARADRTGATTITIQYAGSTTYTQDGVCMVNRPLQNAMLLVDAPGTATTEDVSSLVIAFDPKEILKTANTMFASDSLEIRLHPHMIEFKTRGLSRYAAQLPFVLAGLKPYPRVAEDTVHRFITQLIVNPIEVGKRAQRNTSKTNQVNMACAYMMEHLSDEITLTDLERVSLLSSRTLQMEFLSRFGLTPMNWLLHRRLERAYQLIQKSAGTETIASAAQQCGFRHMGRFSASFRSKFGIRPSEALRKLYRQ